MIKIKIYLRNLIILSLISFILLELILNIIGLVYKDFRKNEFISKKKFGKSVSIITIGDSYTYGGNVKWNETYSYILWKKLDSTTKNVKINLINAGICEYNSSQVLYDLDWNINKYNPNYAIILVGSSDFWNLIDPYIDTEFYIKNSNYNEEQKKLKNDLSNEYKGLIKRSKTYKLFKLLTLNLKLKNAINDIENGLRETDEKIITQLTSKIFMEMLKKKQYSKVIEYSIKMLKTLPPESIYFSKSLSIFYAISVSYRNQSKYTSEYISNELNSILQKRTDLKNKKFLIKYINYFSKTKKFETQAKNNLKSNLLKIYSKLKLHNITLIFLTYPSEYKIANSVIREISSETNSYLIDLEKTFKDLNLNNNFDNYFDDDEHINSKGHKVVAEEIFNFLKSKI